MLTSRWERGPACHGWCGTPRTSRTTRTGRTGWRRARLYLTFTYAAWCSGPRTSRAAEETVKRASAHRRIRRPVRVPAHVEPRDVVVHAAHAMRQAGRDVDDVAHFDLAALATEDLALLEYAAGRQRPAAFEHHPQIGRDGMHQPGLGRGDAADVHVVLAALDHAKRLELLRIHVLQVLGELVFWNGDRMVFRCLFKDDRPALAPRSAAAWRCLHPSAHTTRAGGPGLGARCLLGSAAREPDPPERHDERGPDRDLPHDCSLNNGSWFLVR